MTGHWHMQTHLLAGDKKKSCIPARKGTDILPVHKHYFCYLNYVESFSINN